VGQTTPPYDEEEVVAGVLGVEAVLLLAVEVVVELDAAAAGLSALLALSVDVAVADSPLLAAGFAEE
jgi:hypothetical protein